MGEGAPCGGARLLFRQSQTQVVHSQRLTGPPGPQVLDTQRVKGLHKLAHFAMFCAVMLICSI